MRTMRNVRRGLESARQDVRRRLREPGGVLVERALS